MPVDDITVLLLFAIIFIVPEVLRTARSVIGYLERKHESKVQLLKHFKKRYIEECSD